MLAYSGREISLLPDAVIVHDSAHEKEKRRQRSGFKTWLRSIERPFRTGRTKGGEAAGRAVGAREGRAMTAGADDDHDRPMIVEIDKAEDRWGMWVSGLIYGLLIGAGAGFLAAIWW